MLNYKYTLQLDKLTLSLSLNTENTFSYNYIKKSFSHAGNSYTLSHKHKLELRKTKRIEKYYTNSFEVWSGTRKIGTLHTDSRLPQTEKFVKFEFTKSVLYSKPGFLHYIQQLQEVGLFVETVSYFEIAFDTQLRKALLPQLSYIERNSTLDRHNPAPKFRPLRAKIIVGKLANGSEYTFGHGANSKKGTGKQVAVYNKTESIAATGETFITEFHEANGLDISKPVERIEARISSKWLTSNNLAIDENDLTQPETLKTLFIKAVGDCFKFVDINAPEKPKRNAQGNYTLPIKDLLPLTSLQVQPVKLTERWQVGEDVEISDNRKRTAHRVLVDAFISQGTDESLTSLRHFEASTKPPKNAAWPYLASCYAQRFEGHPTAENKARIDYLSAYLIPL